MLTFWWENKPKYNKQIVFEARKSVQWGKNKI